MFHLKIFFFIEKNLIGTHFQNEEENMNALIKYYNEKFAVFFWDVVFMLQDHWGKSVNLNGKK